jgi:iron(III) transport system permease protein
VFSLKKILKLILVAAVFLALDLWFFSTIKKSFSEITLTEQKQLVAAISRSVPQRDEDVRPWLETAAQNYDNLSLLYIKGVPGFTELELFSLSDELAVFFRQNESSEEFVTGLDNAAYLEPYFSDDTYSVGETRGRLVFSPVINEAGDDINGVLLVLLKGGASLRFSRLLNLFALGAFLIFVLLYGIAQFLREPLVGYAVLGLFVVVGIFVAFPLFEALRLTFTNEGRLTLEVWRNVVGNLQYIQALWGSVRLGFLTATFSTIVGFLFAFAITRTTIRGKNFLTAMATMPVISPPFSLTLSIILLAGNNGLITKQLLNLSGFSIYGLWGLTIVQTIGMFPIAFLTLSGVLQGIDSTVEEASLDLNASRIATFLKVTLPLAIPGVLSAWLLVFTNSLADFANPLLLAGSYRVLSVEAYIEVTGMSRLGNGAALSILLLLPTLSAFFAQRYWVSRKSFVTVTGKPSGRLANLVTPPVRVALAVLIGLITAVILGLYGTIVAGCFVKNWGIDYTFTLENIVEALQRGRDAILSTVTLAAIATPVAGLLAMIAAVILVRKRFPGKRLLEGLIMTPFAIPGTLIGISYILAFNKAPFLLVGTGAIIVINYIIRELPVGLEGGVATLRQIDPAIEEAGADLGADPALVFRKIVLPLIRPAFISSMSYTFVRSMTAVSAIIFLISARWYHITVLIYNFSENIRFGLASVLSTTLIIIVLAVFGLMRLLIRQSTHLVKTMSV